MKTAKEYRTQAKQALSGNWGVAIGICIVYCILNYIAEFTIIGTIFFAGAFMLGRCIAEINLLRRGSMKFEDLFAAFYLDKFSPTIGLFIKTVICTLLWSLLFIIPGIVKSIEYSMAPYILADHPEMTGGEALKASCALMKGKKWKYFCLHLSFIGWDILSLLTFGILMILWVGPWQSLTETAFYESIKHEVPGTEIPLQTEE